MGRWLLVRMVRSFVQHFFTSHPFLFSQESCVTSDRLVFPSLLFCTWSCTLWRLCECRLCRSQVSPHWPHTRLWNGSEQAKSSSGGGGGDPRVDGLRRDGLRREEKRRGEERGGDGRGGEGGGEGERGEEGEKRREEKRREEKRREEKRREEKRREEKRREEKRRKKEGWKRATSSSCPTLSVRQQSLHKRDGHAWSGCGHARLYKMQRS